MNPNYSNKTISLQPEQTANEVAQIQDQRLLADCECDLLGSAVFPDTMDDHRRFARFDIITDGLDLIIFTKDQRLLVQRHLDVFGRWNDLITGLVEILVFAILIVHRDRR